MEDESGNICPFLSGAKQGSHTACMGKICKLYWFCDGQSPIVTGESLLERR